METEVFAISSIEATLAAVCARNVHAELVQTGAEALRLLQALIPAGAEVMTGGSLTLQQIGFEQLLISGEHPWTNAKTAILDEKDFAQQMVLRQKACLAEYYIGSPQAITQSGEMVFVSGLGSQLPAYAFSSKNVIWVAGIQKIVPTLDDAMRRGRELCFPVEDQRMKGLGLPGSMIGKTLIFERESPKAQRNLYLILVNEVLGV